MGGNPGALASDLTLGATLRLVWSSNFSPKGPLVTKASGIALGKQLTFVWSILDDFDLFDKILVSRAFTP